MWTNAEQGQSLSPKKKRSPKKRVLRRRPPPVKSADAAASAAKDGQLSAACSSIGRLSEGETSEDEGEEVERFLSDMSAKRYSPITFHPLHGFKWIIENLWLRKKIFRSCKSSKSEPDVHIIIVTNKLELNQAFFWKYNWFKWGYYQLFWFSKRVFIIFIIIIWIIK